MARLGTGVRPGHRRDLDHLLDGRQVRGAATDALAPTSKGPLWARRAKVVALGYRAARFWH
jgi:hypothetical protein